MSHRAIALAMLVALSCAHALAARTLEVSARRVEFRRYEPDTGKLLLHLLARSADMSGEQAGLSQVRLILYEDDRPTVVVQSQRGEYRADNDARLFDGVRVEWEVGATFRSVEILWSQRDETLTSDFAVLGSFRSPEDASALELDFTGHGLRMEGDTSEAEILREVAMTGRLGDEPFAASADSGVVFRRRTLENRRQFLIEMRGPVAMSSRGGEIWSDRAELRFRPGPGGRLGPDGAVVAGSARVVVAAAPDAVLPGALLPSIPRGAGGMELRADLIEISPGGAVTLHGTMDNPARVIFDRGELRGTRIDLSRDGARTDGGAPSEFDL